MKSLVHLPIVLALLLPLLASGCGDDADDTDATQTDAGSPKGDAGVMTPPTKTNLARPALPRPPSGGLPADLRPPR